MGEDNELNNASLSPDTDNQDNTDQQNNDIPENADAGLEEEKNTNTNDGTDDKGIYGAPEIYDYKDVKIPQNLEYDKDMLKEFDALNKETNLSQAQANKYMEFGLRLAQKHSAELPKLLQQAQQAKITQFKQALNTDTEIGGGDKAKMNAYLDTADKGFDAFADDEVKSALADSGLNYHPAIIKMFHRIGELVGDDKIYAPKIPSGTNDAATILYGNS